ncbi:hypothetical protein [Nonomuraea dietziae]|uniref:hypothetical protein n=1 Tax=Nonomuraea dietziae TaxID=65515 RepID=UPI0033FDDF62
MKQKQRTSKMLVVADESGRIISAAFPGVQSDGAPTETGLILAGVQVAHEVEVPEELKGDDRPDLSIYRLRLDGDHATLERTSGA